MEETGSSAPVHERCTNCDTPLRGPYCHVCGQKDVDLEAGIGDVVREFVRETFELDGRLPRTLVPYLFRPGFLTREFAEGRRAAYTSPVRLYVFVALVSLFGWGLLTQINVDRQLEDPVLEAQFAETKAQLEELDGDATDNPLAEEVQRAESPKEFAKLFMKSLVEWMPLALLVAIGFSAPLLAAFHWRRPLLVHLVFSLHEHGVSLVILLLSGATSLLFPATSIAGFLVGTFWNLVMAVHVFVALRVVYGDSFWLTLGKFLAMSVLYLAAAAVVITSIIYWVFTTHG